MAEVIGIVASGAGIASLAVQIAESMKKLKEFYDGVRDAPQDLVYFLQYLHTLDQHIQELAELEISDQWVANSGGLKQSIDLCQNAAQEVLSIVKQLEAAVARNRKWGSIRTVLKKHDLKKLDERLIKAISLLTLSCVINRTKAVILEIREAHATTHTTHTTTHTHQLITGSEPTYSVSQDVIPPDPTPTLDDALAPSVVEEDIEELVRDDQIYTRPPATRKKTFRFRIPMVFARTVFEFYHCHSRSGWDTGLRTRNVVPWDSPLFCLARRADVDGVMALFQSGQASPFDVDEYGDTALTCCLRMKLDHSSLNKIFKFTKFMIAQAGHDLAINSYDIPERMVNFENDTDLTTKLYIHISEQFDLANFTFDFMTLTGCSPAVMKELIRRLEPPLHSYPLQSRLELALSSTMAYHYGCRHIISGFNARLGCELTDSSVLEAIFSDNAGSLNRLVGIFGIAFGRGDGMAKARLVRVLEAGDKLSFGWTGSMASFLRNAIVEILEGTPREPCDTRHSGICTTHMLAIERKASEAIIFWTTCLVEAGIDLKCYGRRENMAMKNGLEIHLGSYMPTTWWRSCLETFSTFKILVFDISDRPESWKAHFFWGLSHFSLWESLAGNFWDLVERSAEFCQVMAMPGSWDPEWNRDRTGILFRPGYVCERQRPNKGWRVKAAKAAAREEAMQAGMSRIPDWLLQQHRKRMRRGAILKGRYVREGREWWSEQDRAWHYDDSWVATRYVDVGAKELDCYERVDCWIDV